ncbi:WD40-repeat-containing domain protein [Helicostylum pulchrum]|nr:WD40-repeat-containing domain protein [Helicostylum pulchrum]
MNSLYQVDELVKEYLLFRGFTATFRALETEIRSDKDKGFQVDKIIEELLGAIANGDIQALIDYYRYLDIRFFSRLDSRFQRTIKKFELCLLRHYLIHAMQHKKREKVIEFFDIYGPELHGKPEWSQWFALPYIKNPSNDSTFETFFSKQWVDNYTISLHNFLATTFQNMPLPSLLSFNIDRIQRKNQQTEIETLKSTVENQKATLEARDNDIAKLKHEVAETRKEMTDGISLIRRRAASSSTDQKLLKPNASVALLPKKSNSESTTVTTTKNEDEPFIIVSQDEFSEHASSVTHAKFSSEGDLIASCDMDNIVRIWSYKGQSFNPLKIKNSSSILSLEWDARSDRFLYLGTDTGLIRVYNVESKSIVQEFIMDDNYLKVNHISSSPVEPIFVCAGSSSSNSSGALVAWSMKTMSACGTFQIDNQDEIESSINTIKLNHNGQMLVAGDTSGLMRIFDIRSMKSIIEWKGQPSCTAQFSFDENSIYSVDGNGELSQWSIHKPGTCIFKRPLEGFPPPETSNGFTSSNHIPPSIPSSTDNSATPSLLSVSPRSQLVAFSADTDYVLCSAAAENSTYGSIYRVLEGDPVLKFGNQSLNQHITTVDWTNSSNACLLGSADGSVKVTTLIKV